jgi:hypothetical protein
MHATAGNKLTAEWYHTLNTRPETNKSNLTDLGHEGPIMVYLSKEDNAAM